MVNGIRPTDLHLDDSEKNFKKLLHNAKESCI